MVWTQTIQRSFQQTVDTVSYHKSSFSIIATGEHTGRKHTHMYEWVGYSQSTGRGVVTLCPPTHHVLYYIEAVLTPDKRTVINHEAGYSTCPTLHSPTGNGQIVLIIAIEIWIYTRHRMTTTMGSLYTPTLINGIQTTWTPGKLGQYFTITSPCSPLDIRWVLKSNWTLLPTSKSTKWQDIAALSTRRLSHLSVVSNSLVLIGWVAALSSSSCAG